MKVEGGGCGSGGGGGGGGDGGREALRQWCCGGAGWLIPEVGIRLKPTSL